MIGIISLLGEFAEDKLRHLITAPVEFVSVLCKRNITGSDLTKFHDYEYCFFRVIHWEQEEQDVSVDDRMRPPIKNEPLNHIIPRYLFGGFIDAIVEINLTWTVSWKSGGKEDAIRIIICQDMELMEKQPIEGQTRYRVDKDKPVLITIE